MFQLFTVVLCRAQYKFNILSYNMLNNNSMVREQHLWVTYCPSIHSTAHKQLLCESVCYIRTRAAITSDETKPFVTGTLPQYTNRVTL